MRASFGGKTPYFDDFDFRDTEEDEFDFDLEMHSLSHGDRFGVYNLSSSLNSNAVKSEKLRKIKKK